MSLESPQLEDGFTPVANTIMEPICYTRLSGTDWAFLHFLWRKTYGWSKPSDTISLSQFCDGTGLSRAHVCRTIKKLLSMNVIFRRVARIGNGESVRYEFNKHIGTWKTLPKLAMPSTALPALAIQPLPELAHTTYRKDTTSKRLEEKNSSVIKKRMNTKVPLLTFDPSTQSLVGELVEAEQRFAAAFPTKDFHVVMEKMRVWIVKKGNPHKTYWKTLCTIAEGEDSMKKISMSEIGKSNVGEW